MSRDEYLRQLSYIQNQKQEQLITLQDYTIAYTSGEIGKSSYRLKVRGVTNKVERIQKQLVGLVTNKDLSPKEPIIIALDKELESLRSMSVNLSSVSERHIVEIYNKGVEEQNQLTIEYKNLFKAMLEQSARTYTEKDGMIVYK